MEQLVARAGGPHLHDGPGARGPATRPFNRGNAAGRLDRGAGKGGHGGSGGNVGKGGTPGKSGEGGKVFGKGTPGVRGRQGKILSSLFS